MEVVKRKKNTEVGMLPIDWEIKPIGDEIDLLTGFPFPSNKYTKTGVRLLRGSNIKRGKTNWEDNITEYWPKVTSDLKKFELQNGDIVIPMDGSLVGKSYAQLSEMDLPCVLLQRVARIRSASISIDYLKQFIGSGYFEAHCDSVKTVTAIPHISPKDIREFTIPFPPTIKEQDAIANVLKETDALIDKLEKIIEKKRSIKQGAMQKLFNPKADWETKTLGAIGKTYGGLSGKSKSDFQNGNCPYIPFLNVLSNPIVDVGYLNYVKIKPGESQNNAMKGDLFFNGSSETPEDVGMCSVLLQDIPNLYLNSFCFGFRLKKELRINGLYLSYFFRSGLGRRLFYSSAQGATRYNLSKNNFLKTNISLPDTREQDEIAAILSDMDKEILQLEEKLRKMGLMKQGMMQQLLTGKIRLI